MQEHDTAHMCRMSRKKRFLLQTLLQGEQMKRGDEMRSIFTGLAFLMILSAVMPAVRRSLYPMQKPEAANLKDHDED